MVTNPLSTNGRDIFFILAIRFPVLVMRNAIALADWLEIADRRFSAFDRYEIDRLAALANLSTSGVHLALREAQERVRQHSSKP